MTSFSQLPDMNLWKATSSQCSLQSAVFIRSLLTAMGQQDFGAIQCGFDKALQLSLGIEAQQKSASSATGLGSSSPLQQRSSSPMNNTTMSNMAASMANTFLGATSTTMRIPQPPQQQQGNNNNSVPRGTTTTTVNHAASLNATNNLARRGSSNAPLVGGSASLNATSAKHHHNQQSISTAAASKTENNTIFPESQNLLPITLPNPASLNHPLSLFSFSSLISKTAVFSVVGDQQQQHAYNLLENNNKLISSHPTLSLYADWLFFCFSQSFTVLQTQHCLLLLSELLEALRRVDPVEEDDNDDNDEFEGDVENTVEDLLQAYGNDDNNNNKNSPSSTANSSPSQTTTTAYNNNGRTKRRENSQSSHQRLLKDYFGGAQVPESVVETLTNFLAKSCARKEILVVDEKKLKQVQLEQQKAAEEAERLKQVQAAAAAQSTNARDGKNKGKHAKLPPKNNNNSSQSAAADASMSMMMMQSQQQHNQDSNEASQQQQQQQNGVTTTTNSGRNRINNNNLVQDPNPHVKQIVVDPVFNSNEVEAICAFVTETVLQQWRLVSVLQRAPDGLTLPSTEEVIIETIPVALPSLQFDGTAQKIYSDTQARSNLLKLASNTLQDCYNEAIAERNITILPEFDRSTSVATRRDKTMREDDARKQMRPDEFKRTVNVLARVMGPEKVLEQLAANPVALNKEDEVSLEIARKTKEQEDEYRQAIREYYQEQQSSLSLSSASHNNKGSPSASPGSSVSNLNIAAVMARGNDAKRNSSSASSLHQQQQQFLVPQPPIAAADRDSSSGAATLTLEQRLERLENAIAIAAAQQQNQSPGSQSRRHHR